MRKFQRGGVNTRSHCRRSEDNGHYWVQKAIRWLVPIALAGSLALPATATDLDEQYRPLPSQGQVLWDFDLAYTREWLNPPIDWVVPIYGDYDTHFFRPATSVAIGLTDRLKLTTTGDYTEYRDVSLVEQHWSGQIGLTFRMTPSLQFDASISKRDDDSWSQGDPMAFYYKQSHPIEEARLSASWISEADQSRKRLLPDLDGLDRPLLNLGQHMLTADLTTWKEQLIWDQIYAPFMGQPSPVNINHSRWDNRWRLNLGWRFGFAPNWEAALRASHTGNYNWLQFSGLQNVWMTRTWGEDSRVNDAEASVTHRFGPLAQIVGAASYSGLRKVSNIQSLFGNQPPMTTLLWNYADRATWRAQLSGSMLSRPTREGGPLRRDLDGLMGPILDPGQIRWDAGLSIERSRYRYVWDRGNGRLVNHWWDRPLWEFKTALTYGISRAWECRADLALRPYFIPIRPAWWVGQWPVEDVWQRGNARVGAVYRPSQGFQASAFYEYAVERTSKSELESYRFSHERHRLSVGFSWLF